MPGPAPGYVQIDVAPLNGDGSGGVEAFDAGAIGDWSYATHQLALDGALINPTYVWVTTNGAAVVCSRTKSGPIPDTEPYILGISDPRYRAASSVANDPSHTAPDFISTGGIGLPITSPPDDSTHFFQRGYWAIQTHLFTIQSTVTPNKIAEYDFTQVRSPGNFYYYGSFIPPQPAKLVFKIRYDGVVGQTIPANTFQISMAYGNPDTVNFQNSPIDFALPHGVWVDIELPIGDSIGGGSGTWNRMIWVFQLYLLTSVSAGWFDSGFLELRVANGRWELDQ